MLGWFKKDPIQKLEKEYMEKMEEARDLQRSGDIQSYARKVDEAEQIGRRLDELRAAAG